MSKSTVGRIGAGAGPPVSQQALAAKAEWLATVENQVIEDRDVHCLSGDSEPLRECEIALARPQLATRMIVRNDQARALAIDRHAHDLRQWHKDLGIVARNAQQLREPQVVITHGNDKQLLLAMNEYWLKKLARCIDAGQMNRRTFKRIVFQRSLDLSVSGRILPETIGFGAISLAKRIECASAAG